MRDVLLVYEPERSGNGGLGSGSIGGEVLYSAEFDVAVWHFGIKQRLLQTTIKIVRCPLPYTQGAMSQQQHLLTALFSSASSPSINGSRSIKPMTNFLLAGVFRAPRLFITMLRVLMTWDARCAVRLPLASTA